MTDLAHALGVSQQAVAKRVRRGTLMPTDVTVTGRPLFRESYVKAIVSQREDRMHKHEG